MDEKDNFKVSEQVATGLDMSRQAATGDDLISIKEARQIFLAHNRAITERTLQRYCEKNYLVGQKRIIDGNDIWFVLKSSVHTRIAEMDEFDKLRPPKTGRDQSRLVAEENKEDISNDTLRQDATGKKFSFDKFCSTKPIDILRNVATRRVRPRHTE